MRAGDFERDADSGIWLPRRRGVLHAHPQWMGAPAFFGASAAGPVSYSGAYLISAYAGVVNASFDPTATSQSTWSTLFGPTISVGLFSYDGGTGARDTGVASTKTIPYFSLSDTYTLIANNGAWSGDLCNSSIEFMTAAGVVKAAIQTTAGATYQSRMVYGVDLLHLSVSGATGAYSQTDGILSFTSSMLTFTHNPAVSSNYNNSFSFACDLSAITQIRVSTLRAKSGYTGGASAQVNYKIN